MWDSGSGDLPLFSIEKFIVSSIIFVTKIICPITCNILYDMLK